METLKAHWEKVYATKQPHEVSWTQEVPRSSLDLIQDLGLALDARIIDIGGGDSRLVDHLLERGYMNVSVLDISGEALQRAQQRLGEKAAQVTWIESDILDFQPQGQYDLWHDRAAFHFLTTTAQIQQYVERVNAAARQYLVLGTFSDEGPLKCSGLEVRRYDEEGLQAQFQAQFAALRCFKEDHTTPFQTQQNFLFCSFQRR